jgi:hypothetical protein
MEASGFVCRTAVLGVNRSGHTPHAALLLCALAFLSDFRREVPIVQIEGQFSNGASKKPKSNRLLW